MKLATYHKKRNFKKTPEPKGHSHKRENQFIFVIQKHAARNLHYDFRIELDGVLKSWAVPKGPCLDPTVKRLAVEVEDHPIDYASFEGLIPKGEYGGGTVMLWDQGHWTPLDENPKKAYQKGHLRFELSAKKLKGRWDLIRFKEKEWFLVKYKDSFAKALSDYDITRKETESSQSGQSMEEISKHPQRIKTKKGYKKSKLPQKLNEILERLKAKLSPSPFPKKVEVQLATLVNKAPKGDEWLHEVKFDGYRILSFKNGKKIHFVSRNHKDWTAQFKNLVPAIQQLAINKAIFDGEIVVLDEKGHSNFQRLQNSIKSPKETAYFYYLFDLLYLEKYDLGQLPLTERKAILATILTEAPAVIRYSDHIIGQGESMFDHTCNLGLEGIISKKADSNYEAKRSRAWLKVKCVNRQEFVIGGFSEPKKSRQYFGSLYLGVFDKSGQLIYTGHVGTGFTESSLRLLYEELKPLISSRNPFSSSPSRANEATWVRPKLVAEVEFSEWTEEGKIRHSSFKGLRKDKDPKKVIKEK